MNDEFYKQLTAMAQGTLPPEQLPDIEPNVPRAPAYLEEQLLERTRSSMTPPPQQNRRHMELFLYRCKIGAALAATLVFIMVSPLYTEQKQPFSQRETIQLNQGSHAIHEWLQDFSSHLVREGTPAAREK
jgi:hypothetical protein